MKICGFYRWIGIVTSEHQFETFLSISKEGFWIFPQEVAQCFVSSRCSSLLKSNMLPESRFSCKLKNVIIPESCR